MPQSTSWNIGVGVTCLIGAVGGMYLAYRGYKHIRKVKELQHSQNQNEFCPICNTKISSVLDTNFISCINCAQIVCRKPKCSKWIASRGQSEWECQLCHDQRRAHFKASEWLLSQLSKKLQISNALDLDDISVIDYDKQVIELNESDVNGTISASQKEYIRAFLEDLLSTLLGGSLDNVLVGPIRKSSDYLPICDHECPGLAQTNLKRLIQKIIAEAARLPELLNRSGVPPRPEEHLPYFDPKKYNQLLATAVLNKVVDSYHNPRNDVLSKDEFQNKNVDLNQNNVKPEKDTQKETVVAPKPTETPKTSAMKIETESEIPSPSAVSSPTSKSVTSDDDSETSEQLLETLIKQQEKTKPRLPDLTSDETNDDEYHSIKSVATDSTWEDNWMFKSKKNTNDGTNTIAMLIPSPTEEVKVLIGDRTADEISDLSDNHDSDNDDEYSNSSDSLSDSDEPPKSPADIPNVLVQNKTVIGGKHPLTDFIENASDFESLTSQNSFSEAKNDLLIDDGDFVKIDNPLLDIEYSTLDMKNGNVEKMKEAINPYVERKVESEIVAKKGDDSVKIEKKVVSEVQTTKEIIADTPKPTPRPESEVASKSELILTDRGDVEGLSQSSVNVNSKGMCSDVREVSVESKSSKGELPAPNNASPKPDHDVNDDDYNGDNDDDDDDDDNDNDDVDVNDSDFDLISINSSEFSYYKPNNTVNVLEDSSIPSPIKTNKSSFDVSNEEICKDILEMVAKQPQDIVVSTIPAVKEETKITINQTVWQPRMMPKVDCASEHISTAVNVEDLVEANVDDHKTPDLNNDENATNTISSFVVVKEYIPDEKDLVSNNGISITDNVEVIPTIDTSGKNNLDDIEKKDSATPKSTDVTETTVNVTEEVRKIEDNIVEQIVKTDEKLNKPVEVNTIGISQAEVQTTDLKEPVIDTLKEPVTINIIEQVKKIEEVTITEIENKTQIPTIEITPNTPVSINVPETVEKLTNVLILDSLLVETTLKPEGSIQINSNDVKKHEAEVTCSDTLSVNVTEEVRKIEEKLEPVTQEISEVEVQKLNEVAIDPQVVQSQLEPVTQEISVVEVQKSNAVAVDLKVDEINLEPVTQEISVEVQKMNEVAVDRQVEEIHLEPINQEISVVEIQKLNEVAADAQVNKTQLEPLTQETLVVEVQKLNEVAVDPKVEEVKLEPVIPEISVVEVQKLNEVPADAQVNKTQLEPVTQEISVVEVQKLNEVATDPQDDESQLEPVTHEISVVEVQKLNEVATDPQVVESQLKPVTQEISVVEVRKMNEVATDPQVVESQVEPVTQEISVVEVQKLNEVATDPQVVESQLEPVPQEISVVEVQKLNEVATDPQVVESQLEPVTHEISVVEVQKLNEVATDPQVVESQLKPVTQEISVVEVRKMSEVATDPQVVESQVEPVTQEIMVVEVQKLNEVATDPQLVESQLKSVTQEISVVEVQKLNEVATDPQVVESQLEPVTQEILVVEVQKLNEVATDPQVIESQLEPVTQEISVVEKLNEVVTDREVNEAQLEPITLEVIPSYEIEEPEIDHALEPQIDLKESKAVLPVRAAEQTPEKSKAEVEIQEEPAIKFQIQTSELEEIVLSEPVSVIVTEEVRKIEEKLEETKNETAPQVRTTDIKEDNDVTPIIVKEDEEVAPNNQISVITPLEEVKTIETEDDEVKDYIIVEKLEVPIAKPESVIVTEEVKKIEENLLESKIETCDLKVMEQGTITTIDKVGNCEVKMEEFKKEIQEVSDVAKSSQIIEDKLEESTIEPQIQTTDIKVIEIIEPVPFTDQIEVQKNEEKLVEEPKLKPTEVNVNLEATPIEVLVIPTSDERNEEVKKEMTVILQSSEIVENKLETSIIEPQNNKIEDHKQPIRVAEEVQKLEEKLEENPLPVKTELKIQTTDMKGVEEINPSEQISVFTTEYVQQIEKVEEMKTEVTEVSIVINASQIIEEKLEESIVEPEIQTTNLQEPEEPASEMQLPKLEVTLGSIPKIELTEFQSFPISTPLSQSSVIQSPEPLQLTITSEITPKQLSPPADREYEIITESEIKSIPKEIESTMKSSQLVSGVTTKKVSTVTLTLQPIESVIERPSTPPTSEAVDSNSLAHNFQIIKQTPLGSRYSSPMFKQFLPTSPPPPVLKLTKVEIPKPTNNITNTSTSSIIVDTDTVPITKTTKDEEDEVISVEAPLPGSIAEREHKKWENAAPIANNPYSVESLERRLSQKSSENPTFQNLQSQHSIENGGAMTPEKHLVDVFKADVPTIKRFGRDYYINEAKKASGERLRRSELLRQQLHNDSTSSDDHTSDSEYQNFLYVRAATEQFVETEQQNNEHPLQKSKSSGDTHRLVNENIFAARPIMVEEDDPLLVRAQRIEALSTDERDFFLLPIEEVQMNIGFSSSEASSLRSPSSLSEDSDTARIYNLRSQEIKKVKEPEPKLIQPNHIPKSPTVLKPTPTFETGTAPPPAKLSSSTKLMSKSVPMFDTTDSSQPSRRELADDINNNIAIEEELKHVLPSVKNLAKAFAVTNDKPAPGPINKPKTPWHSASNLSKPADNDVVPPKPQPVKISEPFIRPGYSISGRSISKQVKDELREITPKSVDTNNNNKTTVSSNAKIVTPPRTPSPTPVPGALRNTLAFFENLNKH